MSVHSHAIGRAEAAAVTLFIGAIFVLATLSHHHDWDQFLTFLEVDRRAWLSGSPPLWSYQFCGGSPRVADPQSFGLSPFFSVILLFGPWWGARIYIGVAALAGWWAMRALLLRLTSGSDGDDGVRRVLCSVLALAWISGNDITWHLHVGHVTFANHYVAAVLLWFAVVGVLDGLSRRQWVCACVVASCFYLGGLYPSLMFLLLPFMACLALSARSVRAWLHAFGPHVVGGLIASWRLWAIASHQSRFPRSTVEAASEHATLLDVLANLFAPTWAGQADAAGPGLGIWERSAFSMGNVLALTFLLWLAAARVRARKPLLARTFACLAIVSVVFSLGRFAPWAPAALLNDRLLHGALRSLPRFQSGVVLCALVLAATWGAQLGALRPRLVRKAALVGAAGAVLNLGTFVPGLGWAEDTPGVEMAQMNRAAIVHPRTDRSSYMYSAARQGMVVLNCYSAMAGPDAVSSLSSEIAMHLVPRGPGSAVVMPLVMGVDAQSECAMGTYVTTTTLVVAPSCPDDACVWVNAINPNDNPPLARNEKGRWCRTSR